MLEKYLVILCVGAFIRDSEGKILIVKKSLEEKVDGGLWTVPGGKIEPEEHIIDGLKREVMEEVGLHISSYEWLNEDVFPSGGYYFHGHHYLCTAEPGKIKLEQKLENYAWITKEDLDSYEFHPNIRKELDFVFSK